MQNRQAQKNMLASESSPYLLQHATNPVNWFPWNDEVLERAKNENKLIIVSIGYSACHWCHVMEKESFEDQDVAAKMNEHYVSIKVDREERPDIDQVYMNAVQLITGQGGWPLNCIALPDGSPVYGGTYFQKDQWLQVIETLATIWKNEPQKLFDQAEQLKNGIYETELIHEPKEKTAFIREDLMNSINQWKHKFDTLYGGDDYAPKFPMPDNYKFLLNYAGLSNDDDTLEHVIRTLNKMASGGIYDHLRGGFARYSVDKKWFVPHFEKMLYDNAQLVSLYSKAYQLTRDNQFKNVVYHTLEFVNRELSAPEGGFYSALDADSEGEEGKFYVWSKKEITDILGDDTELFCDFYGIIAPGNWESGKNILFIHQSENELTEKYNIEPKEFRNIIQNCRSKLIQQQDKRSRPSLDDKILTSWNALMTKAFAEAYQVFADIQFLNQAIKNAGFIQNNLLKDDFRLDRSYKNGKSKINAFLDDYAFFMDACLELYQATFETHWLNLAHQLMEHVNKHFYDENSGMYYYTSDMDRALVARKMELSDNVIASSNSVMAKNLFKLGSWLENKDYHLQSEQMLTNILDQVYKYPKYYSNWGILLLWHSWPFYEIVFSGEKAHELKTEWHQNFIPNHLTAGSKTKSDLPLLKNRWSPNETRIFVCKNNTCNLPVNQVKDALEQVKKPL